MPPRTPNAIDEARSLVERRLKELDEERARLERALAGLTGGRARRRRGGRPRATPAARQRRRGSSRAEQAASVVSANPGVTASAIAKELKVKPNYIYRVMADLQRQGRVRKQGRAYHPAG